MQFNAFLPFLALTSFATAMPQGVVVVPVANYTVLEAPVAQAAALIENLLIPLQDTAVGAEIASLTQGNYDGCGAMLYASRQVLKLANSA